MSNVNHCITLAERDRQYIESIFHTSALFKKDSKAYENLLAQKYVGLLFYEPSTRTFASFATAVKKLGGQTLEFQNMAQTSSVTKGETIADTIRVMENYVDAFVMRHPDVGSVTQAADVASVPIINAGDGSGHHPSQALMDLFTMHEHRGSLDGITILIAGDLLYGRTVHSLLQGLSYFSNTHVYLLCPPELALPEEKIQIFRSSGHSIEYLSSEKEIPKSCDVWYWTRVQKERFSSPASYEKVKNTYILSPELLQEKGDDNLIIMHPLPRVGEIQEAIDKDKRAIYLTTQPRNGLFVRMALLSLLLT